YCQISLHFFFGDWPQVALISIEGTMPKSVRFVNRGVLVRSEQFRSIANRVRKCFWSNFPPAYITQACPFESKFHPPFMPDDIPNVRLAYIHAFRIFDGRHFYTRPLPDQVDQTK